MRVRVDRDLCISAAACVSLLPEVFELDEEGKAIIKKIIGQADSEWTDLKNLPVDVQVIMATAKSCPTNAIIIEDDSGQQIYP